MKKALFILLLVSGCKADNMRTCVSQIQSSYCKPVKGIFGIEYDCSGVTNPAYDAAIKQCLDLVK